MATRPLFIPDPTGRLVREATIDFEWYPGFASSQKQKSIKALHEAAMAVGLGKRFLEISTKSTERLGRELSAFNLQVSTGSDQISLEAAFQGSKVFSVSGQRHDLYRMRSGQEIKKHVREFAGERVIGFRFEGREWETEPKTAFYDWLYVRALAELDGTKGSLRAELEQYDGFSDIEFNPKRAINCQARSCALFVALSKSTSVRSLVRDPDAFIERLSGQGYWAATPSPAKSELRLF